MNGRALTGALAGALCLIACGAPASREPPPAWLLAARPADDAIHATDTEADLVRRFGAANVRRDTVWLAEGDFAIGTVVHAADPRRRLEVRWRDTAARALPEDVALDAAATGWRVVPGVGPGTTLAELERLNGRAFTLLGFEFDYGGTVTSWNGGALGTAWGDRVVVRLRPPDRADTALVARVSGDAEFPSTHEAMRALRPRVHELYVRPR